MSLMLVSWMVWKKEIQCILCSIFDISYFLVERMLLKSFILTVQGIRRYIFCIIFVFFLFPLSWSLIKLILLLKKIVIFESHLVFFSISFETVVVVHDLLFLILLKMSPEGWELIIIFAAIEFYVVNTHDEPSNFSHDKI